MRSCDPFSKLDRRLRQSLQDSWEAAGPRSIAERLLAFLLTPWAWIYGGIMRWRRLLYRRGLLAQQRLPRPVISVGALRVGGSGKTPLVLWMAGRLAQRGYRVGVLSRGYRGRAGAETRILVRSGLERWDPADCGDEPYLIARSLPDVPVSVHSRRYTGGLALLGSYPVDLFLMDDGFQHLKLKRDCDVVLVSGEETSRCACLPRGPLREPASALRDATVMVRIQPAGAAGASGGEARDEGVRSGSEIPGTTLAGPQAVAAIGRSRPGRGQFEDARSSQQAGTEASSSRGALPGLEGRAVHQAAIRAGGLFSLDGLQQVDPAALRKSRIMAFCGIARPGSFWKALASRGLSVERRLVFPDHHPYSGRDHERLTAMLSSMDLAVTTEKDAVKIARFEWPPGRVLFLRIELVLEDEGAFWRQLEQTGVLARGPAEGARSRD